MGFPATLALAMLGVIVAYALHRVLRGISNASSKPLPPGPKGLPILGNVNDMPRPGALEAHHWLKHKDIYGPISSVTVFGQSIIVINDMDIALELLRDRSHTHSSRPQQPFASDLVGFKFATAMSPNNAYWKIQRKNMNKIAGSSVSLIVFDRVQEEEAAHFLLNVLAAPDDLFDHLKKEAGAVILKITYGYTPEKNDRDPFVDLANQTMWAFSEATLPGKWPVDIFPFLQYLPDGFPGTGYRKIGREMHDILEQCVERPYAFVKKQMRDKKAKPSFLSQAIESIGTEADMEHVHKWTALALFTGGADTTVSSLMTFFLAMTLFPEVQKKAQEELDRVIGMDRLPVASDKTSLPYIHAVMLETHRWHPVAPMGVPHASTAEDVCRGYRIPKGSIIIPNQWWFTHDPAVYPDPMSFNPDRFFETATHKPEPDPRNVIFGFGRRVCPGRYVADNALFITIAQSLAVFDVRPIPGQLPEVKFETGIVSHPVPYKTSIKPRSQAHRELIERAERQYPWEKSNADELKDIKW